MIFEFGTFYLLRIKCEFDSRRGHHYYENHFCKYRKDDNISFFFNIVLRKIGREYMYYGKWEAAINTLKKHLELPNATWRDERCASIRFIARCYSRLNQITESRNWCDRAINEAPYLREQYMERALIEYNDGCLNNVKKYCLLALKIKDQLEQLK